jgi:GxxExxY protein
MDTDSRADMLRGRESKLFSKAGTEKIIGFAFGMLNEIGHGLHEKIYERALTVLLKQPAVAFAQHRRFSVLFRGVEVGEFVPDLIVLGSVIVETKIVDQITDFERGPMLSYLRITGLRVGLILNFKKTRLEFDRLVL